MKVLRAGATSWQRVDGELVLLQAEAGELIGLNGVGARAWELLDGDLSTDEIAATIAAEYKADPAQVSADVKAFVDELLAARLIEIEAA